MWLSLAAVVARGVEFTADDVTAEGAITLDTNHTPNAAQNGIGAMFNQAARRGLIEFTGRVVRSTAPHRKGGSIRVWRPTPDGADWADLILETAQ